MATRSNRQNTTKNTPVEDMNIGLEDEQRSSVVRILNMTLADQNVLYIKTRNYHWNVVGPHFRSIHALLEEQYTLLAAAADETAERVRQLGGRAIGTMQEFQQTARLQEQPGEYPEAHQMIRNLLNDHEAVIRQLRQDIETTDTELEDTPTSDFLTELAQQHEKMAWMLRSMTEDDAAHSAPRNGR